MRHDKCAVILCPFPLPLVHVQILCSALFTTGSLALLFLLSLATEGTDFVCYDSFQLELLLHAVSPFFTGWTSVPIGTMGNMVNYYTWCQYIPFWFPSWKSINSFFITFSSKFFLSVLSFFAGRLIKYSFQFVLLCYFLSAIIHCLILS